MSRDPASQRQVQAADPQASTWVEANAGSGKTRVLTDRVARLLLRGVDPQHILCLTYTKAAASEMQNRLFRRLGDWAMRPEAELRTELAALGETAATDAGRLAEARRLFARAIETPGGLRIQTIHAFCAGLLRRFPLEAGIGPRFVEMEERAAELLRRETVDEMALGEATAPLVEGVADFLTDGDIDAMLGEICRRASFFEGEPDPAALRAVIGLAPGTTIEGLIDTVFGPGVLADLAAFRDHCAESSKQNDIKLAEALAGLEPHPGAIDLELLESVFLYGDGAKKNEPFSPKCGALPTKDHRARIGDLADRIDRVMEAVALARPDRQRLALLDRTLALIDFARVFLARYAATKLQRGALDFDDLIAKAGRLLTDSGVAPWVLFRLDGGIDHILIDESQDTSPAQWAVIRALTSEFAAGDGARPERMRTIFVVGDKKQSIYSFQGADPDEFDRMQAHFAERLAGARQQLIQLSLEHSFRSAAEILRIVDETFRPDPSGLVDPPSHIAFRQALPGRVDLWPAEPKAEPPEQPTWHRPVDRRAPDDPNVVLAGKIAAEIVRMKRDETVPVWRGGTALSRPVREGDILILVQRRSDLFHQIIRACKAAELEVAGADRLTIGHELAVKDIIAVLRFLSLPEDDLSLAAALKSPLFGWSEQALYTLAQGRARGEFLWARLRAAAEHKPTIDILWDLLRTADYLRPFDLIERLLIRHDGRRRLLARLGPEAEDAIDQLLAQALVYEGQGVPGLTGFLEWVETEEVEVKRQVDAGSNQIRVMTVHGAKGLEAPIVILPDSAKRQTDVKDRVYGLDGTPIWAPRKSDMPPEVLAHREALLAAERRERRRLLYVAMTRAESWLIVCAAGDVGQGGDSWHGLIADAMASGPAVPHGFPTGEGQRYSRAEWERLPLAPLPAAASPRARAPSYPPAPPMPMVQPLSPSDLGGAKVLPGDPAGADLQTSLARGTAMHLLLEHLPAAAAADRLRLGRALLDGLAETAFIDDPQALIGDACHLLGRPDLAHVFGPQSLAEVGVAGTGPQGLRLAGVIDRLEVTPDGVVAVDFKTNRLVPETPAAVPEGILRQMGAYRHLLLEIYAPKLVQVAVLWSATASLMVLPPDLVADALNRATSGLTGQRRGHSFTV